MSPPHLLTLRRPFGFTLTCLALSLLALPAGSPAIEGSDPSPPSHAPATKPNEDSSIPRSVWAVVNASDRTDADRAIDAGRQPAKLLAFLDLKPGMKVGELGAGRGYSTELLARSVGTDGTVYAQNPAFVVERFGDAWAARLERNATANVVRVDREFDEPVPPEATGLDAVAMILFYHDSVWLGADRDKMNKAVFDALKHGGTYTIVDHSAAEGAGAKEAKTLHRIEESLVKLEVLKAGFKLIETANFLRNPADKRDWNAAPGAAGERRGTSDRFVLKFAKP